MNERVTDLLREARERLVDAPRERIGDLQEGRRLLGIPRPSRIAPRGAAWHLGVLLLTDGDVLATGDIVRARAEVRRGFAAESQRRRAELAAAAARGGVPEGETVHIGWRVLDLDALDPVGPAGRARRRGARALERRRRLHAARALPRRADRAAPAPARARLTRVSR